MTMKLIVFKPLHLLFVRAQAHKRLDRERDQKWQEDIVAVKQESARHRLDFERQVGTI